MSRMLGAYGLLFFFVVSMEVALLVLAIILSKITSAPSGWLIEDALFRGGMLLAAWSLLFEVYVGTCSVRLTRYTGDRRKLTRRVFSECPRGVNRVYDCCRPGFLLAHIASGATLAYHVTIVSTMLFGVGDGQDTGPGAAQLAARMAELGGIVGLIYAVQFIRKDRFYLVADPVQPRSRLKRVLAHMRGAAFDGAWSAVWFYGPTLLLYAYGRAFFIGLLPSSGDPLADICTGAAKGIYGIVAFGAAVYMYLYVQDLAGNSGNHSGLLSLMPTAVTDFLLSYPTLFALATGPLAFFFLEDLGADDIGPLDVAASFLTFVQAPLTWLMGLADGHLTQFDFEGDSLDSSLASMLDTAALGLLISTAAVVSWSMCYKLAEIVWTQPPEKLPSDADLVATLQTDLDDAALAPARHIAFAVLNRRLVSADRSCAALYSRRSRNSADKSHWENIVEVCIKVLYEMYAAADPHGASQNSNDFHTRTYTGRQLETYTDSQPFNQIRGNGWKDVNTTMLTRHWMDRQHGEGYAAPGWNNQNGSPPPQRKQLPRKTRVVPVSRAAARGSVYGMILGVIYPLLIRPLTQLLYGGVNPYEASRRGVGGLLTFVITWIDPEGVSPVLTDLGVGLLFGSLIGAVLGVVYFHWWKRPHQLGEFNYRAWIDWWMLAARMPGWWFQPDLSESDAVSRLQGQADGTFIIHRDDSVNTSQTERFRITVTRDGWQPPAPAKAPRGAKKPKKVPSKHSASFWHGTIELVQGKGYALLEAPSKQPKPGVSYLTTKWEVYYAGTLQNLVTHYSNEPYEYRSGQQQEYKLADLSRWSPLFESWHKVWFDRKKSQSKKWLEDRKNGYKDSVWAPLFDKSVDDHRRETFSDFQEVIAAVRCLTEGLATANAIPADPHGVEPEPRLMVLRSVFQKGEQNIVQPKELEWDPDQLEERDIEQLPRIVKALLRVQEGVMSQRTSAKFTEGDCPDDRKVDTHLLGPAQRVEKLPLEVFISTIPAEYYGCLSEMDNALARILWHYTDQRGKLETEFRRTDPYSAKRFQSYLDRESRIA